MDSFFASMEQRDFPEYKGKPLVVGHRGPRSVVAAASYEARKYGVYSAMPMVVALRKCPDLIVTPHRFDVYKEVSGNIQNIFHEYTDLVEPLSLDEAFLDVTQAKKGPASASLIALEIKKEIRAREGLIASAGVLDIMWKRCQAKDRTGITLTLKLRFSDFSTITRSNTQNQGFSCEEMLACMMELLPGSLQPR